MPVLIGLLLVAMVVFFVKSKPEEPLAPQDMVSLEEINATASPDAEAAVESLPSAPSVDKIETEADSELVDPESAGTGEKTVAVPVASSSGFTSWMTPLALDTYIRAKNDGYSESFWKRGHWITAVEGRWNNDSLEFRIALDKIPDLNRWQWQYRVNHSAEEFVTASRQFSAQGFQLVQSQSFRDPSGTTRYQGVWQRKLNEVQPVVETSVNTAPVLGGSQPLDVNNLRFR